MTEIGNGVSPPTITETPTDAYFMSLSVINAGTTTGDRKTNYPIEFSTARYQLMRGSVRSSLPNGTYNRQVGPRGEVPPNPTQLPQAYNDLYNQCLSETYNKLRGQIDLAVELAQAGQTIGMIRSVGQFVRYMRSHDPRDWAKVWLAYQYGWRPLLQTTYDIIEGLRADLTSDNCQMLRIRTRANNQFAHKVNSSWSGVAPQTTYFQTRERAEMGTQWRIKSSALTSIANWSSLNPAGIVWELVPGSFVIDWLVDVGGYLRNLESALLFGGDLVTGWYTYGYSTDGDSFVTFDGLVSPYQYLIVLRGSRTDRYKKRIALSGALFPKRPSFKADLGWQRLLSAAALLSAYTGRSTPRTKNTPWIPNMPYTE